MAVVRPTRENTPQPITLSKRSIFPASDKYPAIINGPNHCVGTKPNAGSVRVQKGYYYYNPPEHYQTFRPGRAGGREGGGGGDGARERPRRTGKPLHIPVGDTFAAK